MRLMRRPFTPWSARGAVVLLSAAAVTAGSGSTASAAPSISARQGGQLVRTSFALASRARWVNITGSASDGGQAVAIDVTLEHNGDAAGTITVQGGAAHVVKIGSATYLKGSAAFWQQNIGTGAAGSFANHWIKVSASNSPLAGFDQFIDLLGSFPASKFHWLSAHTTTFHGQAAYVVRGTYGGQTGTVMLAVQAPHYPLEIKASGYVLYLSDWNHPVAIHAPHGAADLSGLGG